MNLVYLNILKLSFCYYCGPPAVSSWPTRGNCLFKKDRSHYSNLAMKYKTVFLCVQPLLPFIASLAGLHFGVLYHYSSQAGGSNTPSCWLSVAIKQ